MESMNLLKQPVIMLFVIIAFAVGCRPSGDENRQATREQLDKIEKETKQAAQDMKDYTYAQKAEFVAKMRGQLAEINRELDQLSNRVDKASESVKAEAKPKLQALREQVASLNQQLDRAKNATEATWADVKASFKKGYDDVKDGFQRARQWLSDKIAP